jgi:hypothetical protein
VKSYTPFHVDPRLNPRDVLDESPDYIPPSDAELIAYVEQFWTEYCLTIERYFGDVAGAFRLYAHYPYATTIVRLGSNGVILGHKPSGTASIQVIWTHQFDPPLDDLNLFSIQERLGTPVMEFSFDTRRYDEQEALERGKQAAFGDALDALWQTLEPDELAQLCPQLLVAEDVHPLELDNSIDSQADLAGQVYIDEPGGFVREEVWAFEFKHHRVIRASVALLRDIEARLEHPDSRIDIYCLVSSGDLTSIGRHVAVDNPKIRVWDRAVLEHLLHKHPTLLSQYFAPYANALEKLRYDYEIQNSLGVRLSLALSGCPRGQAHFRDYEDIGVEVLKYLFTDTEKLGEPHVQSRTEDGVDRRDVVTRNNFTSRFFQRVRDRFGAEFIIWDFKNYSNPVGGDVIKGVSTYANRALGRLIVVISREGGSDAARAAQLRYLRQDDRMILVVSDEQLQEMLQRRTSGGSPEDILEDLYDELMRKF